MRILRHKVNRKTLEFYRLLFGIRPPYRVLIDGNFVAMVLKLKMEWRRLLPKLLQVDPDDCHLHLTECALAELEALGSKAEHVIAEAKTLPLLKCRKKHGHADSCNAASCIHRLVGPRNEGKWVVVTQDAAVRDELRKIPGVPLILIATNVLVLEPPSDASRNTSRASEQSKSVLTAEEAAAVKKAKAALKGTTAVVAPSTSAAASSEADAIDGSDAAEGTAAARGGAGAGAGVGTRTAPKLAGKKRKRGPSGPNPLSAKRPKQREGAASADASAAEAGKKKRRRKQRAGGSGSASTAAAGYDSGEGGSHDGSGGDRSGSDSD